MNIHVRLTLSRRTLQQVHLAAGSPSFEYAYPQYAHAFLLLSYDISEIAVGRSSIPSTCCMNLPSNRAIGSKIFLRGLKSRWFFINVSIEADATKMKKNNNVRLCNLCGKGSLLLRILTIIAATRAAIEIKSEDKKVLTISAFITYSPASAKRAAPASRALAAAYSRSSFATKSAVGPMPFTAPMP